MTQIWKEDKVIPVTVLRVQEGEIAEEGTLLTIKGKSKGKGFQGVVKRHGFHGGPASHGQKHSHRAPGSIGSTGPQRVIPGKKMAGRMGGDNMTLKKVRVEEVRIKEKEMLIKGPVPGMKGSKVRLIWEAPDSSEKNEEKNQSVSTPSANEGGTKKSKK